jgi:hypothetical protein
VGAGLESVSGTLAHRGGCPQGQPGEGGIRGEACMIFEVEVMCTDFASLGQPDVRAAESAGEFASQKTIRRLQRGVLRSVRDQI